MWIAKETITDTIPLLRQAEFLCVGCIEYTIQLGDKGGLRRGDCYVLKERESHPTHEEKKKNRKNVVIMNCSPVTMIWRWMSAMHLYPIARPLYSSVMYSFFSLSFTLCRL